MNTAPTPPASPPVNVATYLKRMARIQPYKKAVIFPAGKDHGGRVTYSHLTFRQLDRDSDILAGSLQDIGVRKGTRTILMVRPSPEFFILIFALFKAGAVPVVVDPGMGLKRMMACLRESDPEAFIGIPPAHVVRILFRSAFKTVNVFITVGRRWFWGGPTLTLLLGRPHSGFTMADTRRDDTAAILFTTGSTGPAKGVIYTHGNFDAQLKQIKTFLNISTGEKDLSTFPLFALFWPALGITSVIPDMDPTKPAQANPQKIIEAIENHGITNMFASPALLNRVGAYGKREGIRLPSLRRVFSAGAPVSPANIEQFTHLLEDGAEIQTPYGATEAVPIISISSNEILSETKTKSQSGYGTCIGRPINDIQINIIRIDDDPISQWSDSLLVTPGEIGEIVVQGSLVTGGYYKRPEADALSKIKDAGGFWHRMGDLGWQDDKGRFWFCGRKSHRVTTSQGPLFTIPCESIFNNHPAVFRSALVGIGPKNKQVPSICIELDHEKKITPVQKETIRNELLEMGRANEITRSIVTLLFHPSFPVDIRHNSKIFREILTVWAEQQGTRHQNRSTE